MRPGSRLDLDDLVEGPFSNYTIITELDGYNGHLVGTTIIWNIAKITDMNGKSDEANYGMNG